MSELRYLLENDYPWLPLIAAKGDEGARWAAEYGRPEVSGLYDATIGSLKLMGKAKLPESLAVLQEVKDKINGLQGCNTPSVLLVLECWYNGALAYYHYCRGEFSLAEEILLRGHQAIALGVQHQRIILPIVYRCCDTWLHRSRIARSQRDWAAMQHHLDMFRAIHRGEQPFCTLPDGTGVFVQELEEYIQDSDLQGELLDYAGVFCVKENRSRYSDYYAEAIYLLPWLAIRY